MKAAFLCALVALLMPSVIPPAAAGPDPKAPARAGNADALKQEGIKAARAKNWELARAKFAQAYKLDPQPLTLFNLATAQEQTGQLLAARVSFVGFLDKSPPGDHDRFRKLAKDALANLANVIPTLRIRIEGFTASVVIELDGRALAPAQLTAPIAVDPGEHQVAALRGTVELSRRTIALGRGAREELVLTAPPPAVKEPATTVVGTHPATQPPPPPRAREGGVLSSGWFWLATSVVILGGAGAGYYYVVADAPTADATRGSLGGGGLIVP